MKFKFRPSISELNLTNLKISRHARIKGRNKLRAVKCKSLARNYSAENFGVFREEAPRKRMHLGGKIIEFFKNMLSRFRENKKRYTKRARISPLTLLGALCGALGIALTCALIVICSLFLGHLGSYTDVSVPDLVSLSEAEATAYQTEFFEYTVIYKSNPEVKSGIVTAQSPLQGVSRKLYSNGEKIKITLTVNAQQSSLTLPRIVGTPLRDTLILLKSADINTTVINEYSNSVPFGQIIYSSVPEAAVLKKGDSITLRASLGKQINYYSVPSLLGLNEYQATERLEASRLTVGEISYSASKQPIGTVIEQGVAQGTSLKEKSKVSFTLSGGIYYQN